MRGGSNDNWESPGWGDGGSPGRGNRPYGSAGDGAYEPRMSADGRVEGTGMRVAGVSSRAPSLYDKNPLAIATLAVGFVSMVSTLVPSVGPFIAIPMGFCSAILGAAGIVSARRHGNDRADIAVAGITLGGLSVVVATIAIVVSGNVLSSNGTDTIAIATESGDKSLDALASVAAATEASSDICGSDWGTGETRTKSTEVISFRNDMTFTAWTVDYDGNQSKWQGVYSLYFGKEAVGEVPAETADVIYDEIAKSPKFTERGLVTIQMDVNEIDGDREHPVRLVMVGHYLADEHQLYMRESTAPGNTPTVLNRLDDNETGLS